MKQSHIAARAAVIFAALASASAAFAAAEGVPDTTSFAGEDVARMRASLASGDASRAKALDRLKRDADADLKATMRTVMDKRMSPPSGDKHDYASMAPYFWPDPSTPDGLPYIRKDGQYNPERADFDLEPMDEMSDQSQTLALAYYFTGDAKYAERAATLLRAWFIDPATRMNPNVKYAQFRPGSTTDEPVQFGVIEATRLLRVLDADALLAGSSAWTADDHVAMQAWFGQLADYLQTSDQGRAEAASKNNHGTWYAVQVGSYLVYLGKTDEAKRFIEERFEHLLNEHLAADGSQPLELDRTRPMHYSRYNLRGLMQLANLGDRVGLDLWHYKNPKGASIETALDWLLPRFFEPKKYDIKDISDHLQDRDLYPLLRWAAVAYDKPEYEADIAKLDGVKLASERNELVSPPPATK